jgi:hypothetical protein
MVTDEYANLAPGPGEMAYVALGISVSLEHSIHGSRRCVLHMADAVDANNEDA